MRQRPLADGAAVAVLHELEVVQCREDYGVEVGWVKGQRLYPCLFPFLEEYASLQREQDLFSDGGD